MCLKYVAGAQSLYQGIAFIATGNLGAYDDVAWAYPVSVLVFGFLCICFSFGDIENSKWLQIFSAYTRIIVLGMMMISTTYYLGRDGTNMSPLWDWKNQSKSLATVFGNTVFVFIYHHSIPGIIYPIRPQAGIGKMFFTANIVASCLLFTEGMLAYLAFSGLTNSCTPKTGPTEFPCEVADLFNENFLGIPVVGQICQFYPLLNVSAVPILTITLRNNFMQVVPVKRWIRNAGCCELLLQDHRRLVKGIWSIIFSIPVIVIVMFERDPQVMISYTGGICGPFILFLIPVTLILYGRAKLGEANKDNFNRSPYQGMWLVILVSVFAFITLIMALYGAASGTSGE